MLTSRNCTRLNCRGGSDSQTIRRRRRRAVQEDGVRCKMPKPSEIIRTMDILMRPTPWAAKQDHCRIKDACWDAEDRMVACFKTFVMAECVAALRNALPILADLLEALEGGRCSPPQKKALERLLDALKLALKISD